MIDRWDAHPEMPLSQALGEHEFRYAIYPHAGAWDEASVFARRSCSTCRWRSAQAGPHKGELPKEMSFLRIEPEELVLTRAEALRGARDG